MAFCQGPDCTDHLLIMLRQVTSFSFYIPTRFLMIIPIVYTLAQAYARDMWGAKIMIVGHALGEAVVVAMFIILNLKKSLPGSMIAYIETSQMSYLVVTLCALLVVSHRFAAKYRESEALRYELSVMNRELDQRVEERTRQLVDEQQRRRNLMLNVIHDIRSPIFIMRVYLAQLHTNPEDEVLLKVMNRKIDGLQRLVEDLFMSSKLEDEGIFFEEERVCFSRFMDEIVEENETEAKRRKIEWKYLCETEHAIVACIIILVQTQLEAELQSMNVYYHSYQTDSATASGPAFSVAADPTESDAVITTSLSFAGKVADAYAFCGKACPPHTITLSSMGSLSERNDVTQIELNWKRAAKLACMMVLGETAPARRLLQPYTRPVFVPAAIPAKKTEINVLMLEGPETRAMMKLIPDFTRSTGISVRFMVYPYDELHETIRSMESFGFFDVIRMDVAWLESLYDGRLVGFDPADPAAASILEPMLEAVREPFSLVDGTVRAFPFTPNLQLLFYRRDLFEDSKVRRSFYELNRSNLSVPTDYEEYRKLLGFFSRINNPSSPVEYGASVVSGNNTAIVCEFMPILSSLGGRLFDGKGRPCVDTPQAVESLKMYLDIQRNSYQVPSGGWWRASVDSFTHGDTAMMNMFINHVSGITDLRKSRIAGRIGFSAIPGGKPLLGGGVLGIAEHSTKKEAAMEFIRWACSDHISIPFTLLGGISPCRSVYQSEELLELYPWLSIVPDNHLKAVSRHMPKGIDEYRVESVLGRAIKNAIFGICSPEEALRHAQHILEGMTAK